MAESDSSKKLEDIKKGQKVQSDLLGKINDSITKQLKGVQDALKEPAPSNAEDKAEEKAQAQKHETLLAGMVDGIGKTVNGIAEMNKNLLKGLKDKVKGGMGILIAGIAAPIIAIVSFFKQLGMELKFLGKLTSGGLTKIFRGIKRIFGPRNVKGLTDSLKGVRDSLNPKNWKWIQSIRALFSESKAFGRVSKIFGSLKTGFTKFGTIIGKIFKPIIGVFRTIFTVGESLTGFSKIATKIVKFAGGFGRILGKLMLPVTILMSAFDFITGFMEGFEKDGILGGLEGGLSKLFKNLIGMPLDLLKSAVSWVGTKLGFDTSAMDEFSFSDLIGDAISGIFSLAKGAIGWVKDTFSFGSISESLASMIKLIWMPAALFKEWLIDPIVGWIGKKFGWDTSGFTEFDILKSIGIMIDDFAKFFDGMLDFKMPSFDFNIMESMKKVVRDLLSAVDWIPGLEKTSIFKWANAKAPAKAEKPPEPPKAKGPNQLKKPQWMQQESAKWARATGNNVADWSKMMGGKDAVKGMYKSYKGGGMQEPSKMATSASELEQIQKDEGFRRGVYKDTKGIKTIGFGFNLEREGAREALESAGIKKSLAALKHGRMKLTKEEASRLMMGEMGHFKKVAENFVGESTWKKLSQNKQGILTNMAYNMGEGTLSKFNNLRKAIQSGDWKQAQAEMKDSAWAGQVKGRADRLIARMGQNDSGTQIGQGSVQLASGGDGTATAGSAPVMLANTTNVGDSTTFGVQTADVRNNQNKLNHVEQFATF